MVGVGSVSHHRDKRVTHNRRGDLQFWKAFRNSEIDHPYDLKMVDGEKDWEPRYLNTLRLCLCVVNRAFTLYSPLKPCIS